MEYTRSPLRIAVRFAASKGPVRVINTAAYIYRRSGPFKPNSFSIPKYWRPKGQYFVRYALLSFPVTPVGNGFCMEINFADYLRMLQTSKERKVNGSSGKSIFAQSGA